MNILWAVIVYCSFVIIHGEELVTISKIHSPFLESYTGYADVVLLHFQVPSDLSFVSFKFEADELDLSIFGCTARDVTLYMKEGAPPVINPDGSKFPNGFLNTSRSTVHSLFFKTDKKAAYINITAPTPGSYYIATFLPWVDPNKQAITQEGLTAQCFAYVDATLYTNHKEQIDIIIPNFNFSAISPSNKFYKFYVPHGVDHVIFTIKDISFASSQEVINFKIQANRIPTLESNLNNVYLSSENASNPYNIKVWTKEDTWHYIQFDFDDKANSTNLHTSSSLLFKLKMYSSLLVSTPFAFTNLTKSLTNQTSVYNGAIDRIYQTTRLSDALPYKQYNLLKDVNTENFLFSYDLEAALDQPISVPINVTTDSFAAMRFTLQEVSDVGGTLQVILAFKPRTKQTSSGRVFEDEPENNIIVACIRRNVREIPTWPNKCVFNGEEKISPLILNKTVDNGTVYIPYPEPGVWFVTFRLFDGSCNSCNCSSECDTKYLNCVDSCEQNCAEKTCTECSTTCRQTLLQTKECLGCNCTGSCQSETTESNSSVVFDVSSYPCLTGRCGSNGKCMFMVSGGVVYSTCVCSNNYRGWDCTDDSLANSYAMILLELLLLVLSNIMFLPSVYFAYKRKYYVESIVYASTCFFSTFYHACDAGENILSFCIARVSVLQFSDFFSALLSIWVTLIAIANLSTIWPSLYHMGGAIIIAFGVTVNRYSLWVFAVPAGVGVCIIVVSWYLHYRKNGLLPASKRYLYVKLPIGGVIVGLGLIMYAALQTQANYKYIHSLWHIIMAIAVIILLPTESTFVRQPLL